MQKLKKELQDENAKLAKKFGAVPNSQRLIDLNQRAAEMEFLRPQQRRGIRSLVHEDHGVVNEIYDEDDLQLVDSELDFDIACVDKDGSDQAEAAPFTTGIKDAEMRNVFDLPALKIEPSPAKRTPQNPR